MGSGKMGRYRWVDAMGSTVQEHGSAGGERSRTVYGEDGRGTHGSILGREEGDADGAVGMRGYRIDHRNREYTGGSTRQEMEDGDERWAIRWDG